VAITISCHSTSPSIAGGQNTTLFLATPTGEKFSDLERHPAELETTDDCMTCGQEDEGDEANPVLACEKVWIILHGLSTI
jgi:hypothetical protein